MTEGWLFQCNFSLVVHHETDVWSSLSLGSIAGEALQDFWEMLAEIVPLKPQNEGLENGWC